MQPDFVEIKSALWQKIFASVVALPFIFVGLACCVSPWLPIFSGPAPPPVLAIAVGLLLGGFFFGFWWPIMRYSIRADRYGIAQFNGFFRQSVRWAEVANYYLDYNPRYHAERRSHVEPVMLDERGKIVFQGFAHIIKSTNKIIEQRRELWRFVEAQLAGKRVEKPFTVSDAQRIGIPKADQVWRNKSWTWKIARIVLLILYGLFWLALAMLPTYYVSINNIILSESGKFGLLVF